MKTKNSYKNLKKDIYKFLDNNFSKTLTIQTHILYLYKNEYFKNFIVSDFVGNFAKHNDDFLIFNISNNEKNIKIFDNKNFVFSEYKNFKLDIFNFPLEVVEKLIMNFTKEKKLTTKQKEQIENFYKNKNDNYKKYIKDKELIFILEEIFNIHNEGIDILKYLFNRKKLLTIFNLSSEEISKILAVYINLLLIYSKILFDIKKEVEKFLHSEGNAQQFLEHENFLLNKDKNLILMDCEEVINNLKEKYNIDFADFIAQARSFHLAAMLALQKDKITKINKNILKKIEANTRIKLHNLFRYQKNKIETINLLKIKENKKCIMPFIELDYPEIKEKRIYIDINKKHINKILEYYVNKEEKNNLIIIDKNLLKNAKWLYNLSNQVINLENLDLEDLNKNFNNFEKYVFFDKQKNDVDKKKKINLKEYKNTKNLVVVINNKLEKFLIFEHLYNNNKHIKNKYNFLFVLNELDYKEFLKIKDLNNYQIFTINAYDKLDEIILKLDEEKPILIGKNKVLNYLHDYFYVLHLKYKILKKNSYLIIQFKNKKKNSVNVSCVKIKYKKFKFY